MARLVFFEEVRDRRLVAINPEYVESVVSEYGGNATVFLANDRKYLIRSSCVDTVAKLAKPKEAENDEP